MRHAPPRAPGAIVLSAEPDRRRSNSCTSVANAAVTTISQENDMKATLKGEVRVFRSVESIEEGVRDKRLQQVSFALG